MSWNSKLWTLGLLYGNLWFVRHDWRVLTACERVTICVCAKRTVRRSI